MENINICDIYNKFYDLDKKIIRLKKEKQEYFLDNVNENDKSGEISVPLVIGNNKSDYERLAKEKKVFLLRIDSYRNFIHKFNFYTQGIVMDLKNDGLTEDEINERILQIKNMYKDKILRLMDMLRLIDENPKLFLRIAESERCDYSRINNKDAKNKLRDYDKEIKNCEKERKKIKKLLNLHQNEDSTPKKQEGKTLSLKMFENNGKSLDNK